MRRARCIRAPLTESNDEKLLFADATVYFRDVATCTLQVCFSRHVGARPCEVSKAPHAHFMPTAPTIGARGSRYEHGRLITPSRSPFVTITV